MAELEAAAGLELAAERTALAGSENVFYRLKKAQILALNSNEGGELRTAELGNAVRICRAKPGAPAVE